MARRRDSPSSAPLLVLQRGPHFRCDFLVNILQMHFRVWSSLLQADKSSPAINRGKRTLLQPSISQPPKTPTAANEVIFKCIVLFYPSSCTLPGPVSTEGLSSFCRQEPIRSCLAQQWHDGVEKIYSSALSIYHENLSQWHSSESTDSCRTFFLSQLLSYNTTSPSVINTFPIDVNLLGVR